MTVISVQPRRCTDCQKETQIVNKVEKAGYLVIVSECKDCQNQYQNAFKM